MTIIVSNEIKHQIIKEIKKCEQSLQIVTAFCKLDGVKFIEENINSIDIEKRLLVRFQMSDLLSGATDLSIYNYCKEKGWSLYVRLDLHAKIYIFDKKRCIVSSANLTNKGIINEINRNLEISTVCELDLSDNTKLNSLYTSSFKLNDEVYALMVSELNRLNFKENNKNLNWSNNVTSHFSTDYNVLFTFDFPLYAHYEDYIGYPIEFLGLNEDWKLTDLQDCFKLCNAYLWLKQILLDNEKEMYFGKITANLHSILINDPSPYRKEVKNLLSNLLQWIQDLNIQEIIIDRPNYSQRVILLN